MKIRQETKQDFKEVYGVVQSAFSLAEHSDGNEQDLVNALRDSDNFIKELSLVALEDDKIVGYILFTEAKVGKDTVLVLAPLAILPAYQKKGIGSALIKEGHRIAGEMGYTYSLVLGSETYYPRLGYLPAKQFGILIPEGMPEENFMAIPLQQDNKMLSGEVVYAKEFGI